MQADAGFLNHVQAGFWPTPGRAAASAGFQNGGRAGRAA